MIEIRFLCSLEFGYTSILYDYWQQENKKIPFLVWLSKSKNEKIDKQYSLDKDLLKRIRQWQGVYWSEGPCMPRRSSYTLYNGVRRKNVRN